MIMSGQGWPAFPLPLQVDYRRHICRAMRPALTGVLMEAKNCTKCGVLKSIDLFSKNKNKSYGVQPMCKDCFKVYYQNNKQTYSDNTKKWVSENRDKANAKSVRFREKHPEKVKETQARYREKNIEKSRERYKRYHEKNRDKCRVHEQTRRARKSFSDGKLSHGLRHRLFELQKGKCPCCRNSLWDDFHMDHIIPLSGGGLNVDSNIQLLCKKCNLMKSSKHPVDFMQSQGYLI